MLCNALPALFVQRASIQGTACGHKQRNILTIQGDSMVRTGIIFFFLKEQSSNHCFHFDNHDFQMGVSGLSIV